MVSDYRSVSLWLDTVPGDLEPRAPLTGDVEVDVAIVGAGYTGLWTAYYLSEHAPALRIAVVDKEIAGFGASGRNGGWCSAEFPASLQKVARIGGRDAALALQAALDDTVDEVGRVADREGIDCHYAKGGSVVLARSAPQLTRAAGEVRAAQDEGLPPDRLQLLSAEEAGARVHATRVMGGTYTPHCAAIHPARLVRGLADTVVRRGVRLYERTAATEIRQGVVETAAGPRIRARYVLRATEGFTRSLRGHRRTLAPVYSLVMATEPLSDATWEKIGLAERETFRDYRHLIIYGQRTTDGRLVFGGRGAPYHFGSQVRPGFDRDPRVFAALRDVLVDLFPAARTAAVTHTWGGPLGVPRDWFASVGLDRSTGLGWAGGYVGDGVATANLAGRTLADLVLERETPLVRLPWVQHRSPRWEPEPVRWLGTNLGLRVMTAADAEEARTGVPSRRAAMFGRFLGH